MWLFPRSTAPHSPGEGAEQWATARSESGLELERETKWKLSLPTALPKRRKKILVARSKHALSLFAASGTRGKQPVPLHLQPAEAAGHESLQQRGRLAGMGCELRLVTEESCPPDRPHSPHHLPSPDARAWPNPSHAASGFWARRVPRRSTKERLAQSTLSPGNWQLYISFYSTQRITMSKQSSSSKPGHNRQLLPLPRWHSSPQPPLLLPRAAMVPSPPKGPRPCRTQPARCSPTGCHPLPHQGWAQSLQQEWSGKMVPKAQEMSPLEPADPRAAAVTPSRKGNEPSTARGAPALIAPSLHQAVSRSVPQFPCPHSS